MPELTPLLKKDEIDKMVAETAHKISSDYQARELVVVGILKGAFIFLSDLVRHLTIPVQVDFMGASSYGYATSSSETIRVTKKPDMNLIKDKDVLIVEDIIDTGLTLEYLIDYLKSSGSKTVRVCAFIDKQERRMTDVKIDYACHTVEEGFLVGYGLDYAENYRHLPDLCLLKL